MIHVPRPSPPFLHDSTNQELDSGKAWERGKLHSLNEHLYTNYQPLKNHLEVATRIPNMVIVI